MLENTARELFPVILNMSLTAGAVILLVLPVRLALRRAPKVFSYALWAVVLFRLLCPVSVTAGFSLLGLLDAPVAERESGTSAVEYVRPGGPLGLTGTKPAVPTADRGEPAHVIFPVSEPPQTELNLVPPSRQSAVLPLMWLTGVGAMALYSLWSLLALRRRLVGAVRLKENIWLADHIHTPFVLGLMRPKIYLPSSLEEREREYIVFHERYHIRRLDHIVKLLAFGALCLHWFNPLVWLAFVLAGKDMEMSCDEAVLKKLGGDIRADYSASLLSLATGRTIIAGTPLAFGEGDAKRRIQNLLRWKRPKLWVVVCAGIACAAVIAACAANPAADGSQSADRIGAWADVEEFLRSEDPKELNYYLADGEASIVQVLDVRLVDLKKDAEVQDLELDGTLELWSCARLVRLDTDPDRVQETGGLERREDGWFDISGQGGCLIFVLRYEDGSCDVLRFDEATSGMEFANGGSVESALRDWCIEQYGLDVPQTGPRTLRAVLDSIKEGEPLQLSLTVNGEAVGSYDSCWDASNARYLSNRLKGVQWTYIPWDRMGESPAAWDSDIRVRLSEVNGWSIEAFSDTSEILFYGPEGNYWFRAENAESYDSEDTGFAYSCLRQWFDELEYEALDGYDRSMSVVVPDRGQGHLAAAEEYCQIVENIPLSVTSGSKFKYTFVKTYVEDEMEQTEHLREWGELGENQYAFYLTTAFVPENQTALHWSMAGNTGEYTGSDPEVPEGAFEYYRCGYVSLEEDGWHGQIVGTGW